MQLKFIGKGVVIKGFELRSNKMSYSDLTATREYCDGQIIDHEGLNLVLELNKKKKTYLSISSEIKTLRVKNFLLWRG